MDGYDSDVEVTEVIYGECVICHRQTNVAALSYRGKYICKDCVGVWIKCSNCAKKIKSCINSRERRRSNRKESRILRTKKYLLH